MNQERANYVESEFKKWKEHYEVGFAEEYDIKLLLGLRHQLEETPDDRIKTKVDLINAISKIQQGLRLKPIQKEEYVMSYEMEVDPGKDYTRYKLINLNTNKKISYNEKLRGSFSEQADIICQKISTNYVTKAKIDKAGIGSELYDQIKDKSLQYGFQIDEEGNVHKVN